MATTARPATLADLRYEDTVLRGTLAIASTREENAPAARRVRAGGDRAIHLTPETPDLGPTGQPHAGACAVPWTDTHERP